MAIDFFGRTNQDDEEQRKLQDQFTPEKPLGGESAMVKAGEPMQPGQPTRSGSFTNLQQYLDSNESQKFGTQVAQKANDKITTEGKSAVNTANEQFRGLVDQNTIRPDEELFQSVKNNPIPVANDEEKYNRFSTMRDAKYRGPQYLADAPQIFTPVETTINNARSLAKNVQDEGGRKAFLEELYGSRAENPRYDYTSGEKKLDNYLIQTDPTAKAAFEQLGNTATNDLQRYYDELKKNSADYAQKGRESTLQARQGARGSVGIDDAGNWLNDSVPKQILSQEKTLASDINSEGAKRAQLLRRDLKGRKLTDAELALTGLRPGMQMYGIDAGQYIHNPTPVDYNDVSTADERNIVSALAKLANNPDNFYTKPLKTADEKEQFASLRKENTQIQNILDAINSRGAAYRDAINNAKYGFGTNTVNDEGNPQGAESLPVDEFLKKIYPTAKFYASGGPNGSPINENSPYIAQYLEALNKLKSLQEQFGYNDVLNGGPPSGTWDSYDNLGRGFPMGTNTAYDWKGKPIKVGNVRF